MGINSGSLIFKKVFAGKASSNNSNAYFNESFTAADARLGVLSPDVWSEAHEIPNVGLGDITGSVAAGDTASLGIVRYYSASVLCSIPGSNENAFSASRGDWIPFNFGTLVDGIGPYNYKLTKNDGTLIPLADPSNWTFDTEAGVLIFHDGAPSGVTAASPPLLTAYAYDGGKLSTKINTPTISSSFISASEINASSYLLEGLQFITSTVTKISSSTIFGSGSEPSDVIHSFTGSISVTGSGITLVSGTLQNLGGGDLGTSTNKWTNLFAKNTFFGGIHEVNLETEGLHNIQEGTVLTLKNGILQPCEFEADPLVMAITSKEGNYPIVMGAEPVLVTGKIKEGDYIITSNIKGHGKGVDPNYIYDQKLFGKIIAQSLENSEGLSHTIKAMIRKM